MWTFRLIIALKKVGKLLKKQLQTPMPLQGGRWDSAECECVCGSSGGIQKMLFADDQPAGRENFRIKKPSGGLSARGIIPAAAPLPLHPLPSNPSHHHAAAAKR